MTLIKGTVNGVDCVVDDSDPSTPVSDVTQDGGDIVASSAALLANSQLFSNTLVGILLCDGSQTMSVATPDVDYLTPDTAANTYLTPSGDGSDLTNLNASAISSGIVGSGNGGAGAVSGILKANGSGVVSAAVAGTDYVAANLTSLSIVGGTVTTNSPVIVATQTWNSSGVTFNGIKLTVTNTASGSASLLLNLLVGATGIFSVTKDGTVMTGQAFEVRTGGSSGNLTLQFGGNGLCIPSDYPLKWNSVGAGGGSLFSNGSFDTSLSRAAANIVNVGDASTGGATHRFISKTATQVVADTNNYNPGGRSYFQRWSTDAARTITGLVFASAGIDGEKHEVHNVGSQNIVLANESASSTAANRFTNNTAADITLGTNAIADMIYDGTTSRWRVNKRA